MIATKERVIFAKLLKKARRVCGGLKSETNVSVRYALRYPSRSTPTRLLGRILPRTGTGTFIFWKF